jgi:hypothetical protein
VTSTRPSAVGSMLDSCRVADTTNAANEAAAGRYDPKVLSFVRCLAARQQVSPCRATTAAILTAKTV